jgi:capsid assembly protease
MHYSKIIAAVNGSPWAILPEKLAEMQTFLRIKAAGGDIPPEQLAEFAGPRPARADLVGRVALLAVHGVLAQRVGMLDEASGGIGTEAIAASLDQLVADKRVKCIVLAFDSPGGSVFGISELGAKIAGLGKKCVAVADSMAASAAYWLASQCKELYCTPGGQVGSVGVLAAHLDYSEQLAADGIKATLVHAGEFKCELASEWPLSPPAKAEMQGKVDFYYEAFTSAVASGRKTTATKVKANYGKGRMMTAEAAKDAGMIDGVKTLQQVLKMCGAFQNDDKEAPTSPSWTQARARAAEVG